MTKKLVIFLGLLITTILFGSLVKAALGGEGLTISPPLVEIELKAGESRTNVIRVSNPTSNVIKAYPKALDFKAKGETGEPAFTDPSESTDGYSLSKWITFKEPVIVLAPEQVKEFEYTIKVPTEVEPGGHYAAVFLSTNPTDNGDQSSKVSLSTMIGSLILARTPGDIQEAANIEDFSSDRWLYLKAPARFTTRINNTGNIHIKPSGSIEIKGWYGAPKEKITFNDSRGNVLPNSIRKFENDWGFGRFAFGYFSATVSVGYGDKGQTMTDHLNFFILPWWLVALLALIFVATAGFVLRAVYNRRNYRKISGGDKLGPPAIK